MTKLNTEQKKFVEAINNYNIDKVKLFLTDTSFDPTFLNNAVVRIAARYNLIEILKLFIEDGRFDINTDNHYVLRYAAFHNNEEIFFLVINNTPDIDLGLENNYFLKAAIQNKNFNIVKYILKNESFIKNFKDKLKQTPNTSLLINAARVGEIETVRLYLKYYDVLFEEKEHEDYENSYATFNHAIQYAADSGYLHIVKMLFNHPKCDPYADENKAFSNASLKAHKHITDFFLSRKYFDPSFGNNKSLLLTIKSRNIRMVEKLLEYKSVRETKIFNNPIGFAHKCGYNSMLKLLWKVNQFKDALKKDSAYNYEEIEKDLLSKNIESF